MKSIHLHPKLLSYRIERYCYAHHFFRGNIPAFKGTSTCCTYWFIFAFESTSFIEALEILAQQCSFVFTENKKKHILFIIYNFYQLQTQCIFAKCNGRKMQVSFARFFLYRLAKCSTTTAALISSPQSTSVVDPSYGIAGRTEGEHLRYPQGTATLLIVLLRGLEMST